MRELQFFNTKSQQLSNSTAASIEEETANLHQRHKEMEKRHLILEKRQRYQEKKAEDIRTW